MIWGGLPPQAASALSTSTTAAIAAVFIKGRSTGLRLQVRLEPCPHLLRELFEPRRVDEEQRDARHLVDGPLDPGQRLVGGANDAFDFGRPVPQRVTVHSL